MTNDVAEQQDMFRSGSVGKVDLGGFENEGISSSPIDYDVSLGERLFDFDHGGQWS
jgi:hypothetical protein